MGNKFGTIKSEEKKLVKRKNISQNGSSEEYEISISYPNVHLD